MAGLGRVRRRCAAARRRAGLPVLPGLLRRDEVAAGEVDHAIRLTAARTDRSFLWPARHQAGAASDPSLPPMGAWFRLKAGFDVSRFRPDTQVVLRAMQRHGLIVADNGSNWYFTGTSEPGWDTDLLDQLKTIPAGAFEAVDTSSLMADPDSGRVASSSSPPPTTTPPGPTATTARPKATTTTTRAKPTTTTTQPASSTTTAPAAEPSTTTTAPAEESTTTTTSAEVAAPAPGSPADEAAPPRRSRRWWLGIPVGLALATGIAAKRRRP